jgi:tetratricopeptide (TPR) repeat protein
MKNKSPLLILGFLSIVFISTLNVFADSSLDQKEIANLFRQGNELFHQANIIELQNPAKAQDLYHQSAMQLERIINKGGVHNGKLYYNLGNTYFKMHDLGRAILNYRYAEVLMPDDPNLRQNLEYARSKCLDRIPEKQEKKVLQTLFFWHYDFSTRTRTILFGIFFFVFWILVSARLFIKKLTLNWPLISSGGLALILVGSLTLEIWNQSRNISGVILASEVTARKGDSETYQSSFNEPLHAGTEFDLLENRGEWYHVELSDGRSCWVPAKTVGLIK